jgi:hypothetical protein
MCVVLYRATLVCSPVRKGGLAPALVSRHINFISSCNPVLASETGGICVSYQAIKIIALSFAARVF